MNRRAALAERYGERVVENLDRLAEYCDEAASLVGFGRDRFLDDMILQRAAEAILGRVGDVIRHRLPEELLTEYPGQPWRLIVGQRIRVAHGYDTLDYEIIWATLETSIPQLREYVAGSILGDS